MGTNNIRGVFPSLKMNLEVRYETLLERDYIFLLEYAQEVSRYRTRPFNIRCNKKSYTVTFLVEQKGYEKVVECIRIKKVARPTEVNRLIAIEEWCLGRGLGFEKITDEDIRSGWLLENIKHIHKFARYPVDSHLKVQIQRLISQTSTPRLEDILHLFGDFERAHAYVVLMNMIWNHEIQLPLESAPIPRYLVAKR